MRTVASGVTDVLRIGDYRDIADFIGSEITMAAHDVPVVSGTTLVPMAAVDPQFVKFELGETEFNAAAFGSSLLAGVLPAQYDVHFVEDLQCTLSR